MLLAKLVGEGFDRPGGDSELPLDINYAKISEWLVRLHAAPRAVAAPAPRGARSPPP